MFLTKDFIAIQDGFKSFEHIDGSKMIFAKYNEEKTLFILTWNNDKTFYLQQIEDIVNEKLAELRVKLYLATEAAAKMLDIDSEINNQHYIVAKGKMDNIITFFKLISDTGMCGDSINLPSDIVNRFVTSTYEYNELQFEWTTKTLMCLLASIDDYEKCTIIRNHYNAVTEKNNWASNLEIEFA